MNTVKASRLAGTMPTNSHMVATDMIARVQPNVIASSRAMAPIGMGRVAVRVITASMSLS